MTSCAVRPAVLTLPSESLRLATQARMSFSEPLVCSGVPGRSSTHGDPAQVGETGSGASSLRVR